VFPFHCSCFYAHQLEARHVIEAAGVDTWFLKLPSGDWEEVEGKAGRISGFLRPLRIAGGFIKKSAWRR